MKKQYNSSITKNHKIEVTQNRHLDILQIAYMSCDISNLSILNLFG